MGTAHSKLKTFAIESNLQSNRPDTAVAPACCDAAISLREIGVQAEQEASNDAYIREMCFLQVVLIYLEYFAGVRPCQSKGDDFASGKERNDTTLSTAKESSHR